MGEVKITDLVPQETLDNLKELDGELQTLLTNYTNTAKELAKGLQINVKIVGDIDKLDKLYVEKTKEAATATEKLNAVVAERSRVLAQTTPVVARQLMEQERVNKAQREAYTEYDRVNKMLEHFHDTYQNQLESMAKINRQLEINKKQQKENENALKAGKMSAEEFNKAQLELMASTRELTQQKRTLNQIMTAEEKANLSVEGSYAQLSQKLELLKKALKDVGVEGRNSDFGKELETTIQNLDAHLKDLAADMGEHQRNVGNYAIANGGLKKEYDDLIVTLAGLRTSYEKLSDEEKASENGQKLAQSIEDVSVAAKEAKQSIDENNQALEEARRSLGETGGKTSSVKRDLKELVLEIANLTIEYQNLSEEEQATAEGRALAEHIKELTEQAGVLKDAISDTNAAITNAASDTRTFDQISGAIQLAIDGFGLAEGAAAMLGISEEELAEIQTKLQGAIAASNAVQSIQNALQKQSALMQGVNLVQTKLRTAAENMHTAAQGKGVVATKAATLAQWAFNAAANANPIGLIIVALVAAAAAVWGLTKAFQAFINPSEEAKRKCEEQKQALDDLKTSNDAYIESLKAKGETEAYVYAESERRIQDQVEAINEYLAEVVKVYGEDSDEYKDALERKKEADADYEKIKTDSLNYLLKREAEAKAKQEELEMGTYQYKRHLIDCELRDLREVMNKKLQDAQITWEEYKRMDAVFAKERDMKKKKIDEDEKKSNARGTFRSGGISSTQKQADELKKALQAGEDALLKLIEDNLERQRQAEILSYNRQLKELQDKLAKTKDSQVKMREALHNQIEGLEAEHNRKMNDLDMARMERTNKTEADIIASHLSAVEKGSAEELEWKHKELSNQYHAELLAIKKSEDDKTLTVEQAEKMRTNIVIKYSKLREDMEAEHASDQADLIMDQYSHQQTALNNEMLAEIATLRQKYADELKLAKGNADKMAAIKKKYEDAEADITEKYAIKSSQATINMLEDILKSESLSAEDRKKYEEDLANAKASLAKQTADYEISQIYRVAKADEDAAEERRRKMLERIAHTSAFMQATSDMLGAINDLVTSLYDQQFEKLENLQEANETAGEEEQERITDLVNKKVITEEEGEARKRAAEAKTARENEKLEKKKQQLKIKQAKWDKANALIQATISTSLAIMNALQTQPLWLGIALAAIAGAMGAVQIATIAQQPIPAYAKGTDRHEGGPAIVGDGGRREVVLFNGSAWLTPDTPTLVDIPAGASVLPDVNLLGDNPAGGVPLPVMAGNNQPVKAYDDSAIRRGISELIQLIKAQTRQQHNDAYLAEYERYKNSKI